VARCILISSDFEAPLKEVTVERHSDFLEAVGGQLEALFLEGPALLLLLDEEGKLRGKPRNHRASLLYWWFHPDAYRHDFVVGDILVAGVTHAGIGVGSVPAPFKRWLLDGALFHVEARGRDFSEEWTDVFGWLDDYFEAIMYGIHVREHWSVSMEVRVVEARE
jgi:hypothetical protein